RLLGMKVVMTHHGPDYDRKKWNAVAKGVLKLGERLGVKFANHVITVSKAIAAMVYQKYGREVTAIPNGVVIFPRAAGRHVLSRHNVEQNKYILAVGRFVPEKGFDELLQSFQQFSAKNQDGWKLVIAGDADHDDDFSRKLKQDCRNTSDVVLTGFIKGRELRELYSHAALFVLPSYHEGLPIVLLEALSYGASCLVSDIPANREVCLEKDRYFKPGDIPTMTRKLHQYLDNFSEDSMDRQGMINYIRETYNWDLIAEQTLGLYQQSSSFSTAEKAETYPA
ncbi:MAG: glycosyltransferase, partial [Candidatus Omnitrophica bacterium]|nr:glycosyltransferase [Candidatus Omnitrophota bacterium]